MKHQQKPFNVAFAEFKKDFEKLSYRHSYSETFTHFLDFALYMLDPMKDTTAAAYLESIYTEKDLPLMSSMFWNWINASDNEGEGFRDVLGDLFMEFVSHGRNGQFFTPEPICKMIAAITIQGNGKNVADPACGSGRTLLAAAQLNRHLKFYGADNDITCCKMAALNLIINSMPGEIAHMNTLSLEYYKSYHIKIYNIEGKMIPFFYVSHNRQQSYFFTLKSNK